MPYIVAVSAYMFPGTIMSICEHYYDSGVPVEYVSHVMIYGWAYWQPWGVLE